MAKLTVEIKISVNILSSTMIYDLQQNDCGTAPVTHASQGGGGLLGILRDKNPPPAAVAAGRGPIMGSEWGLLGENRERATQV